MTSLLLLLLYIYKYKCKHNPPPYIVPGTRCLCLPAAAQLVALAGGVQAATAAAAHDAGLLLLQQRLQLVLIQLVDDQQLVGTAGVCVRGGGAGCGSQVLSGGSPGRWAMAGLQR